MRDLVASVPETVERIRACAAHPGWSCALRRQHVVAWMEARQGRRPETWPLKTPWPVLYRLELAEIRGRGIRLSPSELPLICAGEGAS